MGGPGLAPTLTLPLEGRELLRLRANAQRFAPTGISLRHSVHFFVVGSAGGSLRERSTSALIGSTTKK